MKFSEKLVYASEWLAVAMSVAFSVFDAVEGDARRSSVWLLAACAWLLYVLRGVELKNMRRRARSRSTALPPLWKSGDEHKEEEKCDS